MKKTKRPLSDTILGRYFLVPIIAVAVLAAAGFLPRYRSLERGMYDVLLGLRPPPAERDEFLLLNADGLSVAQVGMWPWSRHVMADGLILMREFGLEYAVFDIEYVDRSPRGVDSRFLEEEVPAAFSHEFGSLQENIQGLFGALAQGAIPLEEAEDFVMQLMDLSREARDRLLTQVRSIARDNDEYLGQAARFHGNAYFTTTMLPEDVQLLTLTEEHRRFVVDSIAWSPVTGDLDTLPLAQDIQPAIPPVLQRSAGAGFPNVVVDPDGVRRRVDLFARYQEGVFAQLALRPLLAMLGDPAVEIGARSITLRQARMPASDVRAAGEPRSTSESRSTSEPRPAGDERPVETRDIRIPLSYDGRMMITWPQKRFEESFRHLSFNDLYVHGILERDLYANLEAMAEAGFLQFSDPGPQLLPAWDAAVRLRQEGLDTGDAETIDEYVQVRAFFFEAAREFLHGPGESALLQELDRIIDNPDAPAQVRETYRDVREDAVQFFAATRDLEERLRVVRERLGAALPGSFAVIGHTSISTTDIGVNPFDGQYINVGLHPAVANTILTGDFLVETSPWWGVLAALLLGLATARLIRDLKPMQATAAGAAVLLFTIAAGAGLFVAAGYYVAMVTPILTVFLTFVAISLVKFLKAEGEKSFYLSAFSRYLSADVIGQIIEDPERLKLGGDSKLLTAIFTDVKGFSSIAEQMAPEDLVRLLNEYLTAMSDIILELYGTIDKYEGDAIIAFFGAPIDLEDHARRACAAAIRMKDVERDLNTRFLESGLSPRALLTRVGINTGEMVVGNMGTPRKMDYTIMGHAVNLAARLEGVNKQYNTWILATEGTLRAAGPEDFLARRLDRVRVVGVTEPVQLYEMIAERGRPWSGSAVTAAGTVTAGSTVPTTAADPEQEAIVTAFHQALDLFEGRDFHSAREQFQAILERAPHDGPSRVYLERCSAYLQNPPEPEWDGVYNLTSK